MKKIFALLAVVAFMAACGPDNIKERLAEQDNGFMYQFASYSIDDTVTAGELVSMILERYDPQPLVSRENFQARRDELADALERQIKEDAELGLDFSSEYEKIRNTLAEADSLLDVYDKVDCYSIDYQHALRRLAADKSMVGDGPTDEEDMKKAIYLELDMGKEDFSTVGKLLNDTVMPCVIVTHRFSSLDVLTERMKDHVATAAFDPSLNIVHYRIIH